jgi:phosphoribosyl 1,2-cyclic phosphodiesterase
MEIQVYASSSKGNAYRVSDGETGLLLECGIPYKKMLHEHGFRSKDVAGCLLTHCHFDHSKAIADVMRAGIDVYCSRGTADVLGLTGHRVMTIMAGENFRIGTWTVLPFETEHDATESLGYLLYSHATGERLLFATDTYYIRYRFAGLTHIMLECNYADDILQANVEAGRVPMELRNRLIQSHFSLANVKEFLRANDLSEVRAIHLLHLSEGNSDAERFKREIAELTGKPTYIAG